MPSWNIHTAHVEHLLLEEDPTNLGIRDVNCFLFGNYVPDIYVGYMVENPTHLIDYKLTHISQKDPIPVPEAPMFWNSYVIGEDPSDVTLGAWAHLMCDRMYNQATRSLVAKHNIQITSDTRIKKQNDFATFGRTLPITLRPKVTRRLLDEAQAFPQYSIAEADVRAAVDVANEIVDFNQSHHIDYEPDYEMLSSDFFQSTFEHVDECLRWGLHTFAGLR